MRRGLLFVCRLALICNICYLISIAGRHVDIFNQLHHNVESTIVVLGVVGVFLNAFANIANLVVLVFKKKAVPIWLAVINFLFLVFQIITSYFEL